MKVKCPECKSEIELTQRSSCFVPSATCECGLYVYITLEESTTNGYEMVMHTVRREDMLISEEDIIVYG